MTPEQQKTVTNWLKSNQGQISRLSCQIAAIQIVVVEKLVSIGAGSKDELEAEIKAKADELWQAFLSAAEDVDPRMAADWDEQMNESPEQNDESGEDKA